MDIINQDKKKIHKGSYFWNTLGGMLSAFQNVFFLIFITRFLGIQIAGIYTIAYASANLFANIGRFGVRNYQATDIMDKFSFREYFWARIITSLIMVISFSIYIFYTAVDLNYSFYKALIIFSLCLCRVLDSIEDVYYGLYQKNGRIDIAGKIMTFRLTILYVSFIILVILCKDLLLAIILSGFFSSIAVFACVRHVKEMFYHDYLDKRFSIRHIILILRACFPLFICTFLSMYIGNAPKYSIDAYLNETMQACYGYISMPIFVINLLNNFVFQPVIVNLTHEWNQKKYETFVNTILKYVCIIVLITVICLVGASLLGIPFLSFIYAINLESYFFDLLILILGGGFLAFSGFIISLLTIIRKHKVSMYSYLAVALLAYFLSPLFVLKGKLLGASILYLFLMLMLSVFLLVSFICCFKKAIRDR